VTDVSGGAIPGATIRVTQSGSLVGSAISDSSGRYRVQGLRIGVYELTMALEGFRTAALSGIRVSAGSEALANGTLEIGAMSESLSVSAASPAPPAAPIGRAFGGGVAGGRGSGPAFDAVTAERVQQAQSSLQAGASGDDLGDLFEYKLTEPVTIRQNQSALVPILSATVKTEKVSIWNASTGARPRRAVWLTNSTSLTLDAGSVSIVEGQAFAGEGLVEPVKPGERRLLSYAVDLAMNVAASGEARPTAITRVQLARGLLIQEREERMETTYTARNEDSQARELVIEHPVRPGWTLGGDVTPVESTAAWHRFRITVAPSATATFTVTEMRPVQTRVAINSVTDDQVQLLITTNRLDARTTEALREVLRRKADLARLQNDLNARQAETATIGRDQERVRENMKALKGSADERQLVQRYVRQLNDQEDRLEVLRRDIQTLTTQRDNAQAELNQFIEGLG
jgi:hypothetical protein